ncbi:hypothetical protein BCR42DRAFT_431372 [Absidia repens]|uniref:Uncharacterized protein n=1 Tax=Absidia repens TaxID=90262 RepID=A0A1X2J1S3_9FUNG|nr:hypothetical protein BCR42DRAFT_431372 [Absidia repens]
MSSLICEKWKEDILEFLDELNLIPIQDIQMQIIHNCQQMENQEENHQQRLQEMEDDLTTYISSMRHIQFTTLSLQKKPEYNTMDENHMDGEARHYPGAKQQAATDWIKHMGQTTRDISLIPDDFYDQFIDKYHTMRRQPPLLWVRHQQRYNNINGLSWNMGEKTHMLPMMSIPSLTDDKIAPPSLLARDNLHMSSKRQKTLADMSQRYHTDSSFGENASCPNLSLKALRCVRRLGTRTCYKKADPKKNEPCYLPLDDDLIITIDDDNDLSPLCTSISDSKNDNSNGSNSNRSSHAIRPMNSRSNSAFSLRNFSLTVPHAPPVRSTLHEPTPSTTSQSALVIPRKRITAVSKHDQRYKTTIPKEGTSQYWPSTTDKAIQGKISPYTSTHQELSVVSLSHSLFGSIKKCSSPSGTHLPKSESFSISSPQQQYSSRTKPNQLMTQPDTLSLDSLSIEEPSKCRQIKVDADTPILEPYHASQHELPQSTIGIKHNNQMVEHLSKKSSFSSKPNRCTIDTLGQKQVTISALCASDSPSIKNDKQLATSPSRKPSLFSPGDSLNDFLAIRKPNQQSVISRGFGRGKAFSSLPSSKTVSLKRTLCELEDVDSLYPVKKKEEWKLSSMDTARYYGSS